MKSIYRQDERSMCGWVVKFKRQKETFHNYSHDGVGGSPESLRHAIVYRDEQIQRLATPTNIWVTPPKEKLCRASDGPGESHPARRLRPEPLRGPRSSTEGLL